MLTRTILLSATSLVVFATAAAAQPADTSTSDEVLVTAQKRSETLLEAPVAVQAISNEQLDNAGVNDVEGLIKLIPGASIASGTSRGFETVQIRGVTSGTTGDGLVGYYVDDIAFGIPNLQLSLPARLIDLERVEVLRGPSGTLWGQGSMGGLIRLVTAAPDTEKFALKAQGEYSSTDSGDGSYAFDGAVNIPIIEDRLAVRVSGGYDRQGGFIDSIQTPRLEDINDANGANIRVKALANITDKLSITGTYWRIQNRQDTTNALLQADPVTGAPLPRPLRDVPGGRLGNVDTNMTLWSAALKYDLGFAELNSGTAYIEHVLDFESPLTFLAIPGALNNDSTFDTHSFSQELRLASTGGSKFNWIIGGFYQDATINSDIFFTFLGSPLIDIVAPLNTESWAVFGEISYDLFDGKLTPLFGLRYFEDERTGGPTFNFPRIPAFTTISPAQTANFDSLNPRFNLRYRPTDNATLYFNAAKGFRSGTLQTPAQVAAATTLGIPTSVAVQPDSLWTYEIGGKFALAGDALTLEIALFKTDWNNVQLQFPAGGSVSIANAGDADIKGVEFGGIWKTPMTGLTMQATASFQNAEFQRVDPTVDLLVSAIAVGSRLPAVPSKTFTLAANYERELSMFGGTTFSFNTTYAYRGRTPDIVVGGLFTEAKNDLSISAGLRKDHVSLGVFAYNALNQDDVTDFVSSGLPGTVSIPYPRRIGVKLGLDF